MAGDFSRNTFDLTRHFSGVLMQQGRVLVDAEWNEQIDIQQHRTATETRDVIGLCGTPKTEDGFLITQTPGVDDLLIAPGRYYVDGLLCVLDGGQIPVTFPLANNQQVIVPYLYVDGYDLAKGQWVEITAELNPVLLYTRITDLDPKTLTLTLNDDVSGYRNAGAVTMRRAVSYTTQPDYPTPAFLQVTSPPSSPPAPSQIHLSNGDYLVYLVAWQREVNALEDPRIREVALGGPDTTERRQTVWQVRLLPVGSLTSPPISSPPLELTSCCSDFPEWRKHIAPPTGMMNAQTVPPSSDQGPCVLPPTAGYQRLENQLYRIEVFQSGETRDKSTFVWSRDNATLETTIVKVDGSDVYVTSLGKDDYFSFADGQWVEIVYPESELSGQPRFLAQITGPPDTSGPNPRISLSAAPPAFATADLQQLRLVRWDMTGASVTPAGIAMKSGWMDIEAGIQVEFLEGSYRTGDYWQIPARTATGDIEWPPFDVPNPNPVPQPPLGIQRHYCCLAHVNVSLGDSWTIHDCRQKFPPLTHICADDVCYQGTCDLPGVVTVQDAIDQLCQQRDLRFHNKHLHGWGVVCGLRVTCGPDDPQKPRRHVTVSSGYAIDCDGNDVILNQNRSLDIMSMVQQLPPPPPTSPPGLNFPNGDYSLILDPAVPGSFRVEEFVDPPVGSSAFWDALLNDTLFLDIVNDCLKNVIDFFKEEFTAPGTAGEPVGPGQRLISSLTNLLAQLSNADVGGYVFLSGDSNQSLETQYYEDFILRDFYNKLRKLLQSETFCGMFDKARPFPGTPGSSVNYPYTGLNISTIFGRDSRTWLRVDPTGARAFAFGTDAVIHVYDLKTKKMAAIVPFPDPGAAAGDVVVQDVAFSGDGTQLYAVASLNNLNTMFAVANLSGTQVTWQKQIVIANVVMVSLGTWSQADGSLYALGLGKGLYKFDVAAVFNNPNLAPLQPFNAFRHMSIDDGSGFLVATTLTAASPTADHFDRVLLFDLSASPPARSDYQLVGGQGTTDDDVIIFQAGAGAATGNTQLVRIGIVFKPDSQTTKQLLLLDLNQFRQQFTVPPIALNETAAVKLAYNQTTGFLMASQENNFRVRLIDPLKGFLDPSIFPVQVQPVSIAANASTSAVYVLNLSSNTITAFSADQLAPAKQLSLPPLLAYHSAAINAFLDLLGGLLEYLKDCICEHLLIECPSCDQDDKLFLGVVSIRDNQVSKICNLSQRKYVKSFPTVGYWLSAIPIIPIIAKVIEIACCAALPDIFANVSAPQPTQSVTRNPGSGTGAVAKFNFNAIHGAMALFQQTSLSGISQTVFNKVMPIQQAFTDFLVNKGTPTMTSAVPSVPSHQILGTSVDVATARLQSAGVGIVNVVPYDPNALPQNLAGLSTVPASVQAGETVSLVVNKQNQVLYYTRSSPDMVALQSQVQAGQRQFKQMAEAVNQTTTLGQQLKSSVDAVHESMTASQTALNTASALQTRVVSLETLTTTQQASLDAAKNLQAMVTNLTAQLSAQQAAHDAALAARDKQIAELTTNTNALQTRLEQIETRLPSGPGPARGKRKG